MDAPFENLPSLYQTWGTLQVIATLLAVANDAGYALQTQRLAERDGDGVFVRLLPDGNAILTFLHPATGTALRLVPERTYSDEGLFRSRSFSQRPDIAIEIFPPDASPRVILFDPKYKLQSDSQDIASNPLKSDIDKMHTYRDAIRDNQGRHVVQSADIIYPGMTVFFGQDIGAIGGNPLGKERLRHGITSRLRNALLTLTPTTSFNSN